MGKQIHFELKTRKIVLSSVIQNQLLDLYGKRGELSTAVRIFEYMRNNKLLDVASWNTIISVHLQNKQFSQAKQYFSLMLQERIEPSQITYTTILPAITATKDLPLGELVHSHILGLV
jgi:pentatricopeptide repeat protein